MRVVVDTNVVVSAILRDRLPEKVLLFIICQPDFEWVGLHHFSQFPADAGTNILQLFFFKPIKKGARGSLTTDGHG